MSRCSRRSRLLVEPLEPRLLLAVAPEEQLFVYLLNRARANPAAYAQEASLPANVVAGIAAQPPLAINEKLATSADFHSTEMANNNYFGHTSAVTGDQPNKMARDAGYQLPAFFPSAANNIESLSAGLAGAGEVLRQLIEDVGIVPPGHRNHLLATDAFWQSHREIGAGHALNAAALYRHYWTIHTAYANTSDQFLTGVVYNDANGNQRHDLNEGLAGVNVTVGGTTVQTNPGGGWSILVTAGTMVTVTASGGGFVGTATGTFAVGNSNREVDFISGRGSPLVDFTALVTPGNLQFSQANYTVNEGGTATITVIRTGGSDGSVFVEYATTAGGSAQASADYTDATGVLTFSAGETIKTFAVSTVEDATAESSETINLVLRNPFNGGLGNPNTAVLTIRDNDGTGQIALDAASFTIAETGGTLSVPLTRTGGSTGEVFADYVLAVATAVALKLQATPGQDTQGPTTGTITFGPGVTSQTLTITIVNDDLVEADVETFLVQLQNPGGGATLGTITQATVNIQDNDPLPQVPDEQINLQRLQLAALGFGKSREHYEDFVRKAYARFLGRGPDSGGLDYWVGQMQLYETSNHTQGLRQEQIEAGFLDSAEYKGRYGGVGVAWIQGIYQDLLGRPGEQAGINYWMGQLAAGVPPTTVTLGFTASLERLRNRVADTYRSLLDREPDDFGLNYWVGIFQQGFTTEDIVSGFVGSAEYYYKANRGAGNPAKWVRAAYQDVLFRAAALGEFGYWLNFLKG